MKKDKQADKTLPHWTFVCSICLFLKGSQSVGIMKYEFHRRITINYMSSLKNQKTAYAHCQSFTPCQ